MAFQPFRIALYVLLSIFSIILLGFTASRLHYTRTSNIINPLSSRTRYYDPSVVLLLVTSILSFLWSLPLIFCIGARSSHGFGTSYLMEMIGLFILMVMYLVGAALFTHIFHGSSYCRGFFNQCRVVTAIMAWSWINWVIVTTLLLLSLASLLKRKARPTEPMHGHRGVGTAAAVGATKGGHHTNTGMGTGTGTQQGYGAGVGNNNATTGGYNTGNTGIGGNPGYGNSEMRGATGPTTTTV